ncbi:MAG: M56 family metallopeptidase [Acidobacteriaceae bacterium]
MHLIDSLQPTETWLFNYLLNSLWQLPLLFAAAWLATRALRHTGPATQHRIWLTTLLLQLLLPACTFSPRQLLAALASLIPWHTTHNTTNAVITITTGPAQAHNGLQLPALLLAIIVAAYALTLLYFTARLIYGLRNTAALRRATQPITLDEQAAATWTHCTQRFQIPNAQLAASTAAPYPLTIGINHPLILIPEGMPTTVSTDDLSAALAHELAHIHRHDFAKNLAYTALSIPLAWHPILWLTRKHIAETREMICDAQAAEALTGTQPYARSLLRLAELFVNATPQRNLHAIGIFDTSTFERRVMNLTHKPTQLRGAARFATTALSLLLIAGACTSALALRLQAAAPAPQTTPQPTPQPNPQPTAQTTVHTTAKTAARPSYVIGDPGSTTGQPAQSFKVDIADASGPNPVIKMPTPPHVEPSQGDPNHTLQVTSNVLAGNVINHPEPIYPADAKAAGIQGTVLFHAVIGKDGTITSLKLLSGPPELTKAAWDAVKQWTYRPYLLNGNPVEVDTTITVNFALNPDKTPTPAPAPAPAPAPNPTPEPTALSSQPVVIRAENPKFPTGLSNIPGYFITGDVQVSLVVGKDGIPKYVAIKRGIRPDFDKIALEAVRNYRFKPALLNGNPVEAKLFINFSFRNGQ